MAAHISRIKSVLMDTHKSQPVSQEKEMKKSVFADSGSDGLDPKKQSNFNTVSNLIKSIVGQILSLFSVTGQYLASKFFGYGILSYINPLKNRKKTEEKVWEEGTNRIIRILKHRYMIS